MTYDPRLDPGDGQDASATLCECGCGEPAPIAKKTVTALGIVKGQRLRFVKGHVLRKNTPHWAEDDAGCWIWQWALDSHGYGVYSPRGEHRRRHGRNAMPAHRWVYEQLSGPIPLGLELDHLCRVPACVNPEHLEPVTHAENMRRSAAAQKTHCVNGHPFDEENTVLRSANARGRRKCRICNRIYDQRLRDRRRAA